MVHGVGCAEPRVRHDTHASALAEAKRLASRNPGVQFVVLQAVHAAMKRDVDVFDFDGADDLAHLAAAAAGLDDRYASARGRGRPDDDIPF